MASELKSLEKHIDYIELPSQNVAATKDFFSRLMGWEFEDFGPAYTCFCDGKLRGGFYLSEKSFNVAAGAPLIVFYTENLEKLRDEVLECGGKIVKEIFDFPGGRRFHFEDPSGNEYAFWSDRQ